MVVLVPVKDFATAKVRLSEALDADERAALAREMATTVVRAAEPMPVAVVCDSDAVRVWADELGAQVIWTPGLGLNGAVRAGADRLADEGHDRIVVAHGDLPLATDFAWVADFDGITLVPDRRFDGTNVIGLPAEVSFDFSYGPRSFTQHRAEATRLGLPLRLVPDRALGWDVDEPADLVLPTRGTVR